MIVCVGVAFNFYLCYILGSFGSVVMRSQFCLMRNVSALCINICLKFQT